MKATFKRLLLLSPLLALALAVGMRQGAPAPVLAAEDFRILMQRHFDLLDQGNVAGVMAMFSDDAVVSGASCLPTPCAGKAAIQREIERRVNNGAVQTLISLQEATSGIGSGTLRVTERGFAACNVQRILVLFDVEVRNDRITRFASRPDLTDSQSAAYIACVSAPPPAPAVSPPRTGDAGLR